MDVKIKFDAGAVRYDVNRQKIIPCFDIFYNTVVELIPFKKENSFSFLDLGAGTGLLTALILNAFPSASADIVDFSEKMIAVARKRFAYNLNITFSIMDYTENTLPGMYDLIVSAMSIHHLSHDNKIKLMKKIYRKLKPGGIFINADLTKGSTPATEKWYQKHWMDHLQQAILSPAELETIKKRMSLDLPATLDSQLMWLQQAGFRDVDCFYKYFNFVVYAGRK